MKSGQFFGCKNDYTSDMCLIRVYFVLYGDNMASRLKKYMSNKTITDSYFHRKIGRICFAGLEKIPERYT